MSFYRQLLVFYLLKKFTQQFSVKSNGNDTIDCYPPLTGEIKKILVVSEQKFQEIQKEFKAFFRGLRGRLKPNSLNVEAPRGQIFKLKPSCEAFAPKFSLKDLTKNFRDYEPTKAIYFNSSDWRRWVRVKEWFSQYAQGAE